ncbi:GNAT family N-acetyltransferase [Pseudofulvibacter geojedonensis]|uniref:GNAT family N-acetyltransferase n=1 Tax=Pseudofulvibacter geojedonensis TaxID=1123758 RepID=A0ABW3I397_9FLAO
MIKQSHIIERMDDKSILLDITYVEKNKKLPVVVFCHGYKGYKDWGSWNLMAETLANNELFVLKFNLSHNGGTIENPIDFPDLEAFGENNFSKELQDLDDVLTWITDKFNKYSSIINQDNLCLVGHSRGGGIVTIKASEDRRVAKLITLAGVSDFKARFPQGEQLAYWKQEGVAYIENSRTKQQMPHYYQFYEDFVANEERLTISRAAKELDIPHLIVHGTKDETVTFLEAERLHEWSKQSELLAIEDANHTFGASHPWDSNQLPEDLKIATEEIINFVQQKEIIKATNNDVDELLTVTQACAKHMIENGIYQWNELYPSKEAFENDVDLHQLWVIKDGKRVIGSIVITEVEDEEYHDIEWLTESGNTVYIHRLSIHPSYQGQGLAQRLMSFAESYAKQKKYNSVRLDAFSQNKRNNTFYQKRGYQQLGDIYFPKQSEHPFHCYELVF